MDWFIVNKSWDKWAPDSVGSGRPLKAALLLHYDPSGPSRLLSTIAEHEGINADPIQISQLVNFIKRNKLQTETFLLGPNEYIVTSVHEKWFHARCVNTAKPSGEGALIMQTGTYLLVALYEGSIGSASNAVATADEFADYLFRRGL